ncbi:MAG: hypothetical protein JWM34_3229 [Ilumatobacteraceae bacterium]|nr:hypothetical protein [Ilumatobacteraceae bacterium]
MDDSCVQLLQMQQDRFAQIQRRLQDAQRRVIIDLEPCG